MKKRLFLKGLTVMLLLSGSALAQDSKGPKGPYGHQGPEATSDAVTDAGETDNSQGFTHRHHGMGEAINMRPNTVCMVASPHGDRYIIIDSVDNSIDVLENNGDTIKRVGRYLVDTAIGRHDVANIIRPKSIEMMGPHIIFVASAIKDLGKVGILTMTRDTLLENQVINLPCHAQLMELNGDELTVVGTNIQGYDINTFCIQHGEAGPSLVSRSVFRYHVPQQSERIQQSDPVGVGLTVVAITVVFLALVCIVFIMGGYAKLIKWGQDRRARRAAIRSGKSKEEARQEHPSEISGETYAAIAAAIYLYQEDMHDEESTVLTIDKVERAWTPWNAKFYNMNQYFNTRTRK